MLIFYKLFYIIKNVYKNALFEIALKLYDEHEIILEL